MLYLLGMPLLLGSWWGVVAVPLLVAGMAPRAVGEERMLRRELSGYDEYKAGQVSADSGRERRRSLAHESLLPPQNGNSAQSSR